VRSPPTAGQASIEYVGAIALVALVFILAAPAVGAPSIAGAVVGQIKHALCIVGGDVCTPGDAARAGLAPCPLRSEITGGEASLTAFSVEVGGKATLTVTPLSDGTVLVVRSGALSAGVAGGPSAGVGGVLRFEVGAEGSVRARFQAARGWVLPDRAAAARFLDQSLRDELDLRRSPPTWESVDISREAGSSVAAAMGFKDAGTTPAGAAAGAQHMLGLKETRDGAMTVYARVGIDSAEVAIPGLRPFRTDGRSEWVVEYTRRAGKPLELVLRSATASEGAGLVEDVAARLDLRDPANMAIARPFLERPGTWLTGGGAGKRAVLDRIATHGIVERALSTSEDHSRGGSLAARLGLRFGVSAKKIKHVRRLVDATAAVGGGLTGKRLDCLPGQRR
jgi:hypothetical protein